MQNKELIYELAKKLDLIIEVTKDGKYAGKYKFINNKLHKFNKDEELNYNSKEKKMR